MKSLRVFLSTLNRWVRNPLVRDYEWQFWPLYWRVRSCLRRGLFHIARIVLNSCQFLRGKIEDVSLFRQFLSAVAWAFLLGLILIFVLEFVERTIVSHGGRFSELVLKARDALSPHLETVLLAIAQISCILIGLYYAGMGVIAGTVYARLPRRLQNLFVADKAGTFYLRLLALLGVGTLLLLLCNLSGFHTGVFAFTGVLLLTATAIPGFVVVALRLMDFFDPGEMKSSIVGDLMKVIRSVTPKGYRWRDPSFQSWRQHRANDLLESFYDVVNASIKSGYGEKQELRRHAVHVLGLLEYYEDRKPRIPGDSYWFRRVPRHKSWLTSDDSSVDMAIRTGSSLYPDSVPDNMWFEKEIVKILTLVLETQLDREDFRGVVEWGAQLHNTLNSMARQMSIDECLHVSRALRGVLVRKLDTINAIAQADGTVSEDVPIAIAVVDTLGSWLISIFLGFSERVVSLDREHCVRIMKDIEWRNPRTIYSQGLPAVVTAELESIRRQLEFETRIEGTTVTPVWFQAEIAMLRLARSGKEFVDLLVGELGFSLADHVEALSSKKQYLLAAQLATRGLEVCSKFPFHVDRLKVALDSIPGNSKVPDLPWPEINWQSLCEQVETVHEKIVLSLAKSVKELGGIVWSPSVPDYFGQVYCVVAEETYRAMAGGNENLFCKLFPAFFAAVLLAHGRLHKELLDRDPQTLLAFIMEPLEDLLWISGFGILYSELEGRSFARTTKEVWNRFLDKHPNVEEFFHLISASIQHRHAMPGIYPRDLTRTGWMQDFRGRLRKRGLMSRTFPSFSGFLEPELPKHQSPVICAVGESEFSFYDPRDVFLVTYLQKRPGAKGFELPEKSKSLARTLERWEERARKRKDEANGQ